MPDQFEGIPYDHGTNRFTLYIPKKYKNLFDEIVVYARNHDTSISGIILKEMKSSFRIMREVEDEYEKKKGELVSGNKRSNIRI